MIFKWNESIGVNELNELFNSVGWNHVDDKKLSDSFKYTWKWLSCRTENNNLIGFVRILSDGFTHAYICSMVINKKFQNKGIGSKMIEEILNIIEKNKLKPVLKVKENLKDFYRKFGFKETKNGVSCLLQ